ncbi:hypothetical protein BKP35_08100 [Anaerobacillus arseniciselenatis]|uniref:Uncharacterized protein n=1 Tax=Anaerobacillus arseniciselenatis TaxID=85682 RepID=A0A1S2LPN2_9BACI|nr:hypothetical protein [Anaerobacillus arseniciselenatis]OIJ14150.1 hypothetical protein BKP35_08100 [Anaerobacillus arseniciselenatis]
MKMLLGLVMLLLTATLFVMGIMNIVMFGNVLLGLLSIVAGIIMVYIIKNAKDERECFGR